MTDMLNEDLPQGWYSRFEFLLGVASIKQLPEDNGSEVAIAGRSNVGKSSSINKITNRKSLARTSKLPGRTRELNFFRYSEGINIVDLPGYGYARVNVEMQKAWARLLEHYLQERKSLRGIMLIMDIRHPLGEHDVQMLEFCQSCKLPIHVLLNKSDKLSRSKAMQVLHSIQKSAPEGITYQLFSALNGTGLDEARARLADWLFSPQ